MANTREYIVHSPFPSVPVPNTDLYTYIIKDWDKHGNKVALVDSVTHQRTTYSQLEVTINNVADSLYKHGFHRGSVVAIYCANCPHYVVLVLAAWKLGGVVVFINSLLTHKEVAKQLTQTDAEWLFCGESQASSAKYLTENTQIKHVFIRGNQGENSFPSWDVHLEHNGSLQQLPQQTHSLNDVVAIFFSSGTTGLPKGVELTHRNILNRLIARTVMPSISSVSAMVVYQPFSHLYGTLIFTQTLQYGAALWVMPRFDLEMYISLIAKTKGDVLRLVPPTVVQMAKRPDLLRRYDISNVHHIICGAAPLSLEAERGLLRLLSPGAILHTGYGLTETSAGVCFPPLPGSLQHSPESKQHLVGVPGPNAKIKIIDPDTRKSLPPGKVGEIYIKSPSIMKGYVKNKKATEDVIDTEGWFHSGDLGYHDNHGYVYVIDRLKELIKYKGYQVAPAELEDVLLSHPDIADACVVGIPDEEAGELPLACVVCKSGAELSGPQIQDYVAGQVAPFKRLRGGVKFVAAIPKSPSGKMLRRILKRELCIAKL